MCPVPFDTVEGLTGDRVAIAYRCWQNGMTTAEIAKVLGVPESLIANNIKSIIHHDENNND